MSMTKDEILAAVSNSQELPTLPVVASQIISLTSQEETSLTDIADLISTDIALSTKILKVANSAFYSLPQKISSIHQAVSLLGINAVRSLVLSFSFLSMRTKKGSSSFDFTAFWERSLASAVAAKCITEHIENSDPDEAFVAGLMQNIGQLILALTQPDLYEEVRRKVEEAGNDEETLEEEIIGVSHCLVGFTVAKQWGFPTELQLSILHHHDPSRCPEREETLLSNIHVVYLASILVNILHSNAPENYHKKFRREAKELLGFSDTTINVILREIHGLVDATADQFGLSIQPTKSVEEILQEANVKLSLLNLSYEEMNRELVLSKMALEKLTRELEQKNTLLEDLANIDGLTEVNNHRFFQNFLDKEINRSIRNEKTISILLADIDHFKQFNDTYGHQTGDFILKEFCRLLKTKIREYDLLARYGGEEFIFVLPETEPDGARIVAENVRRAVDDHTFDDGTSTYHVTISIGIACARPSGRDFKKNEFIGLADEALYEAKNNGRNQVAMNNSQKKKKWFSF